MPQRSSALNPFSWLVLFALVTLVVSCQGNPHQRIGVPPSNSADSGHGEPREIKPPNDEESSNASAGVTPCSSDQSSEIAAGISLQTTALRNGDFEQAYAYAADSFRSSVSLESFTELIYANYRPLLDASDLLFRDCRVEDESGLATIEVRFKQSETRVLALSYAMEHHPDGWRVRAASDLKIIGGGV